MDTELYLFLYVLILRLLWKKVQAFAFCITFSASVTQDLAQHVRLCCSGTARLKKKIARLYIIPCFGINQTLCRVLEFDKTDLQEKTNQYTYIVGGLFVRVLNVQKMVYYSNKKQRLLKPPTPSLYWSIPQVSRYMCWKIYSLMYAQLIQNSVPMFNCNI